MDSKIIEEGSTKIYRKEDTFFNPAQKFNRDVTISVINKYYKNNENIKILDAMSATGLRGLRFFSEIKNSTVFLNDMCKSAIENIKENIKLNNIKDSLVNFYDENTMANLRKVRKEANEKKENEIFILNSECNMLMSALPNYFDVIDIDPFGSCSEYIDCALRSVKHNGILSFTATDKAVLCSNEKKCQIKYSTMISKNFAKNEMAVRTVLSLISRYASKYDASIQPILSVSVDFYIRIFVKIIKRNPKSVIENNENFFVCKCHNFQKINTKKHFTNECMYCGASMKFCGPFWTGPLHDKNFIAELTEELEKSENKRVLGLLRFVKNEIDFPFYYEIPRLSSILKTNTIKLVDLMNALANAGYEVSFTHCELNAIKTNAPLNIINEIMLQKNGKGENNNIIFNFNENKNVSMLNSLEYYKGKMKSGMGPLSLPKKNKN